jgi:hypothetical protein
LPGKSLETNWRRERRFARRQIAMTERQSTKLETEIARYRLLEQEVTDPLAASLIHVIISELEAELQQAGEPDKQSRQGKAG